MTIWEMKQTAKWEGRSGKEKERGKEKKRKHVVLCTAICVNFKLNICIMRALPQAFDC